MKRRLTFTLAFVLVSFLLYGVYGASATPGHGHVSVAAAAFQPRYEFYTYLNDGHRLYCNPTTAQPWQEFVAPVALPDGATVTKVTFYWNDTNSALNGSVSLMRAALASGDGATMAQEFTQGAAGDGSSDDHTIDNASVDTSTYAYYLYLILRYEYMQAHGVIIEYT